MAARKPKKPKYSTLDVEDERTMLKSALRQFEASLVETRLNISNQGKQLDMLAGQLTGVTKAQREAQTAHITNERNGARMSERLLVKNVANTEAELAKLPPPPDDSEE